MSLSNNPPAAVLELDKHEAEWLQKTLRLSERSAEAAFRDVASMSSKDPRARFRASLQLAANIDEAMADGLASRLDDQIGAPDVEKSDEE